MEDQQGSGVARVQRRLAQAARTSWPVIENVFDRVADMTGENVRVMRRESDLFLGTALAIVGFFNFQSGKYCDGNATDYLSCTRPSTYYYYGGLEIFLVLAGVFFVLLWFLKKRS